MIKRLAFDFTSDPKKMMTVGNLAFSPRDPNTLLVVGGVLTIFDVAQRKALAENARIFHSVALDFEGKLYVFDGRVAMGFYTDDLKHKIIGVCESCGSASKFFRASRFA